MKVATLRGVMIPMWCSRWCGAVRIIRRLCEEVDSLSDRLVMELLVLPPRRVLLHLGVLVGKVLEQMWLWTVKCLALWVSGALLVVARAMRTAIMWLEMDLKQLLV